MKKLFVFVCRRGTFSHDKRRLQQTDGGVNACGCHGYDNHRSRVSAGPASCHGFANIWRPGCKHCTIATSVIDSVSGATLAQCDDAVAGVVHFPGDSFSDGVGEVGDGLLQALAAPDLIGVQ